MASMFVQRAGCNKGLETLAEARTGGQPFLAVQNVRVPSALRRLRQGRGYHEETASRMVDLFSQERVRRLRRQRLVQVQGLAGHGQHRWDGIFNEQCVPGTVRITRTDGASHEARCARRYMVRKGGELYPFVRGGSTTKAYFRNLSSTKMFVRRKPAIPEDRDPSL